MRIRAFGVIKSWLPNPIKEKALQAEEKRMEVAVLYVQGQVRRSINRGNPTGKNPSKPGEPPKKVSTRLFQSIATSVRRVGDSVIGYIGSNLKYAKALEFGTSKMAARPFFRPVMYKNRAAIARILGSKPRTGGGSTRSTTSRFT